MGTKEEKYIILNRMYTGGYLSTNLGHEVINMFQADNGNHYLYLNARGNLSSDGKKVGKMLLVVFLGNKRIEIVGLAKNLTPIDSAICVLPRDLSIRTKNGEEQKTYIQNNNICYGKVSLLEIFNDAEQQEIFVSYVADKNNFFESKRRLILCFDKEYKQEGDFLLNEHNFGSTSLHQYIKEGKDFDVLTEIINNPDNWEKSNKKVQFVSKFESWEPSLIDICGIMNDENCFSNAICYFMQKYPELWCKIFNNKFGIEINSYSIKREENAKIEKTKWKDITGGRIDLLLRIHSSNISTIYIIIENKIKSDVIEENGISQLERYWNYVKSLNNDSNENIYGFVLAPDYNMPDLEKYNSEDIKYIPLPYSKICNHLEDKENMSIVKGDKNFYDYYRAMKRHSFNSECISLYEEMKHKFYTRIYKKRKDAKKTMSRYNLGNIIDVDIK